MGPTALLNTLINACSRDADMLNELECERGVQRYRFCMPVLRAKA